MIRQIPKIALFIGALALAGQANADHRGWGGPAVVGALVGAAVVGAAVSSSRDRTVYVERQPVYYQQPVQEVYYAPPPPRVVYYQPAYEVVERYPAPPPRYYRRYDGPPPGYYQGYGPHGRW
ncbi:MULTISPECIES: hypothetical protein [Pseudomonas syringae group]|uniref:hypothetical protein n=1 Tax=Pseudomonas syringae group TaxID=136849 RepID=UPI0005B6FBDC|nr:hypothetical protein [Pseudomonas viridiflava]MBD8569520.1 hypothetical protein [Pseudomonas syringae]KIQ30757.1 hypothetical protein RT94_20855 [Pseudomonas viridiflava]MBD8804448.1 hypothetical protein [Pseudomonas syringae]MBI6701504.1 hypothetical protein [Pseudomonas viridiflava]MBI6723945.1 hypothetical protein [Pseudomonas viridiflava]